SRGGHAPHGHRHRRNTMRLHRKVSVGSGPAPVLFLALSMLGVGCATKGYVKDRIAEVNTATDEKVATLHTDVDAAKAKADQAYDKATLAERLANGTVEVTEVSTSDVQFAFDDWHLDADATSTLDNLAAQLSAHPRYALEIRGYADAVGRDRYNYM